MKSLVLICLRYNGIQDSEIMELLENMLFPILAHLSGEAQDKMLKLQIIPAAPGVYGPGASNILLPRQLPYPFP